MHLPMQAEQLLERYIIALQSFSRQGNRKVLLELTGLATIVRQVLMSEVPLHQIYQSSDGIINVFGVDLGSFQRVDFDRHDLDHPLRPGSDLVRRLLLYRHITL